jgi:hypothetical protein
MDKPDVSPMLRCGETVINPDRIVAFYIQEATPPEHNDDGEFVYRAQPLQVRIVTDIVLGHASSPWHIFLQGEEARQFLAYYDIDKLANC